MRSVQKMNMEEYETTLAKLARQLKKAECDVKRGVKRARKRVDYLKLRQLHHMITHG